MSTKNVSQEQLAKEFKTQTGMSMEEFEQRLEQKMESDSAFRDKFLSSPGSAARQLIEAETKAKLSEDFDELFEQGIEKAKEAMNQELSDDDLEQVAGGFAISATVGAAMITGGCAVAAAAIGAGGVLGAAAIAKWG